MHVHRVTGFFPAARKPAKFKRHAALNNWLACVSSPDCHRRGILLQSWTVLSERNNAVTPWIFTLGDTNPIDAPESKNN